MPCATSESSDELARHCAPMTVNDGLVSDVILSLAAAPERRSVGGHARRAEPDSRGQDRYVHLGRWVARRFHPLAAGRRRRLALDRHHGAGLTHWAHRKSGSAADPARTWRPIRRQTGWAATWWAPWRAIRNGDLWVATLAGLSRLHGGTISNFTTANGLSSNVVTALLPRGDGTLLIGTQDHGWNQWDGQQILRGDAATAWIRRRSTRFSTMARASLVCDRQRNCALRLQCHGGARLAAGLLALDRVRHRRRAAQPGDGNQQPSFGVALARRTSVVCHAQGTGGGGPGALSREHDSAAGRAGAVCGGRCGSDHCAERALG